MLAASYSARRKRTLDGGGAVVISQPSGFGLVVSTGIYQFGEYAQRLYEKKS
jgi:hypothetical protein